MRSLKSDLPMNSAATIYLSPSAQFLGCHFFVDFISENVCPFALFVGGTECTPKEIFCNFYLEDSVLWSNFETDYRWKLTENPCFYFEKTSVFNKTLFLNSVTCRCTDMKRSSILKFCPKSRSFTYFKMNFGLKFF